MCTKILPPNLPKNEKNEETKNRLDLTNEESHYWFVRA